MPSTKIAFPIPETERWDSIGNDSFQAELDGGQYLTLNAVFLDSYCAYTLTLQAVREGVAFGSDDIDFSWKSSEVVVAEIPRENFTGNSRAIFDGLAKGEISGHSRQTLLFTLVDEIIQHEAVREDLHRVIAYQPPFA